MSATKRIKKAESVGGGLGFVDGSLGGEERYCLFLKAGGVELSEPDLCLAFRSSRVAGRG